MITNTNRKQAKEYILPILALLLSIGSLLSSHNFSNIFSLVISLTGIAAGITFFSNKNAFSILIQLWIYGQFPALNFNETPILDGGQTFKFPIGFTLGTNQGNFDLYINVIPVIYLTLYRLFKVSELIGNKVIINKFRQDNKLGDIFPLTGTVLKRVQLEKDKFWLLARLDKDFSYGPDTINHLLLKSKDGQDYKLNKDEYISYLRLVNDPLLITDKVENPDIFPFVDWGTVRVTK